MTPEEIVAELRACLALQNEIADKHLELATRHRGRGGRPWIPTVRGLVNRTFSVSR
jgi:hypothetical protein